MKGNSPDLSGLQVRTVTVDGGSQRWDSIVPQGCYGLGSPKVADYPVKPGQRVVKYVLLGFQQEPTAQEFFDEITRRNLSLPDRAITETILDTTAECRDNGLVVVGICGSVKAAGGVEEVCYVSLHLIGRYIGKYPLRSKWTKSCLFIAVVSEEPVPA